MLILGLLPAIEADAPVITDSPVRLAKEGNLRSGGVGTVIGKAGGGKAKGIELTYADA